MACFHQSVCIWILLACFALGAAKKLSVDPRDYEGKVVKGTRNALFLVEHGQRRIFPDFNTFKTMGFNLSSIDNVGDDVLKHIPLGETLTPIAVFRPEDHMYHLQCEDPDRMVRTSFPLLFFCLSKYEFWSL
jgi:hypothetical protein